MSDIAMRTSPPDWVSDLPRDYNSGDGTVVKEVGVLQDVSGGSTYWKAFQLIEMSGGGEEVRTGYYTKSGGWQNKPLMLPPEIMDDLTTYAQGKIW